MGSKASGRDWISQGSSEGWVEQGPGTELWSSPKRQGQGRSPGRYQPEEQRQSQEASWDLWGAKRKSKFSCGRCCAGIQRTHAQSGSDKKVAGDLGRDGFEGMMATEAKLEWAKEQSIASPLRVQRGQCWAEEAGISRESILKMFLLLLFFKAGNIECVEADWEKPGGERD